MWGDYININYVEMYPVIITFKAFYINTILVKFEIFRIGSLEQY